MQVPLLDLRPQYAPLKSEIMAEIEKICDSQAFILGAKVEEFEKSMADYCQTAAAVGVTSGSDALIISLMSEGIKAGDEVITSTFTFFATAGAIARVGATPVFVDIDAKTFDINVEEAAKHITPKTKAIIPVHLFGQCADMDPILKLAKENNLIVIEDACQAIGAKYNGKCAGSMGDYGAFSFFPSKNLGCFGDGGAVTCQDPEKAKRLKIFRNHGQSDTYFHRFIGGNFRLDAMQAAILNIKIKHLEDWTAARRRNAANYKEMFSEAGLSDKIILPSEASYNVRHIYNQFSILVKDGKRDALKQFLASKQIGCSIYYPLPLHLQPCFTELGGKIGDAPVAEKVSNEILALPIYGESSEEQREFVVETIADFYKNC